MPDWAVTILCSVLSAITTIIVMVITLKHNNKQLKEQYCKRRQFRATQSGEAEPLFRFLRASKSGE
jgi:uncharacterized protein YegL